MLYNESMLNLYEKTKEFVKESFDNNEAQMLHFERTVYWLKYLKPDADEPFLIAAFGHDIERASRMKKENMGRSKGFLDKDDLTYHQEKGAEILAEFLVKIGAENTIVERVKHLVSKHEVGGDADQNLLKDVDSISFVENNTQIFLSRIGKLGYNAIKEKFDWMYNRISDLKAKELARPFYEKMILELNKLKN